MDEWKGGGEGWWWALGNTGAGLCRGWEARGVGEGEREKPLLSLFSQDIRKLPLALVPPLGPKNCSNTSLLTSSLR